MAATRKVAKLKQKLGAKPEPRGEEEEEEAKQTRFEPQNRIKLG